MTTTYPGFRDFRTDDAKLRSDLQRWNSVLERAFSDAEARASARWRVVIVIGSTGNAVHGDIVSAGKSVAATIALPRSAPGSAGRGVRVYRSGAFAVTVLAAAGDAIGGAASVSLGAVGYREFVDDGIGNWMANA